MKIELHCMLCGAKLDSEGEHLVCPCCNASYANMLLSESKSEDEHSETLELGISVDCTQVKPKLSVVKVPVFEFARTTEEPVLA